MFGGGAGLLGGPVHCRPISGRIGKGPGLSRSLYSKVQYFAGVELGSRPGQGDPCTVMFKM